MTDTDPNTSNPFGFPRVNDSNDAMFKNGKPMSLESCQIGNTVIVQDVDSYYHGQYATIVAVHKERPHNPIAVHMQYSEHSTFFQPESLRLVSK